MSVSFESAPPASFASPSAAIHNPWLAPAAVTTNHDPPQPTQRYMNDVPIIAPPSPKPSIVSSTGPSSRTAAMLWAVRRRNALVPLELLPPVPRNALVTSVTVVPIQHARTNSGDGKENNAKDNGIVLINPFAQEDKTNTGNNTVNINSSGEQTPTSPASPTTPTRPSTSPTSPTSQQVSFFFSPAPNKRPRLGRRRSSCTQTQQRSPPLSPSACSVTTPSCATTARNVTYFPRVSLTQVTPTANAIVNSGVETLQETKAESEREAKQDSKMIIDTTPSITDTPPKESPLEGPQEPSNDDMLPSYTASLKASDPRREQRSTFVVTVRIANSSPEQPPPSYVSSYFSGTAKASTDPLAAARKLKQDQLENEEVLSSQQSSSPLSSSPSAPWFVPSNALSPPPAQRLKHRPLTLPLSLRKPRFLSLQARQAPLPPLPNVPTNPYAYPAHIRSRAEGNQALPPSEILRAKRPFNVIPPPPPGSTIQRIAPPRRPTPLNPVVPTKPAWNKPWTSSNLATCVPVVPTSDVEMEVEDDEDLSMEMALSGGLEDGVYVPGTLLPNFPGSPADPALFYTSNCMPSRKSSLSRSSSQIARTPSSPSPAPIRPKKARNKNGKMGSRLAMLRFAILNHSGPEVGRRIMGMGVRLAQEIWEAEQIMDEEDSRVTHHNNGDLQLANVRFRSRRRVSLPEEDQEEELVQKEDDMMDEKEEQSFLLTTTTTEKHPMEDVPADNSKATVDDDMDMEGRDAIVPLSEHAPVLRAVPEVQEYHHSAAPAAPVEEKEMMATATPEDSQDGLMSYEERERLADECIRELEEQMEIDDHTPEAPPVEVPTTVDVVNEQDEDVDMLDAAAIPDAPLIAPEGVHPPIEAEIEVERVPLLPVTTPEATVMDPEPATQTEEEEALLPLVPTSDTLAPSSLDFIASLPIPRDRDQFDFGPELSMDLDPDPLRRHPLSNSSRIRLHLDFNGASASRSPSSSQSPRKRNNRLSHLATISSSMASFSITKRWFERMYL
ncbi:hypothetical protein CPB86DRAFT_54477 [Serendipita vermifera]|nr:hypothetical protein CPB86DRAFT_54477 [Serendipita vermifera]